MLPLSFAFSRSRRHRIHRFGALVFGLLLLTPALADDFCTHPRTPVEVTICTHPKLRALDATLNRVYGKTSRALGQTSPASRRATERLWSMQRNAVGSTDVAGLEAVYKDQIREEIILGKRPVTTP